MKILIFKSVAKVLSLSYLKTRSMFLQYLATIIATAFLLREISGKVKRFFEEHSYIRIGIIILFLIINLVIIYQQSLKDEVLDETMRQLKEELSYEGDLASSPTVLLSTKDNIYPQIQFGQSRAAFISSGGDLNLPQKFTFMRNLSLNVSKTAQGKLLVSTKIYNKNGLVDSIENNHFSLNRNMVMSKKYNGSALEVKDNNGDIVLQIVLKDDRIQLQGKFYDPGNGWVWGLGEDEFNDYGLIEFVRPGASTYPNLDMTIHTIFDDHTEETSGFSRINSFILSLFTLPLYRFCT